MHVNPTAYRDFHHTRISLLKSSAFFDFNLAKSAHPSKIARLKQMKTNPRHSPWQKTL